MVYVKHFNILGIDTAQVPCIELQGVPNTATEGAVGLFGMNMASADHEIYVCIAVNGNVYTWIPLKGEGGNTVTDAKVNDDGELVLTLSNGATINAGVVREKGLDDVLGKVLVDGEYYALKTTTDENAVGEENTITFILGE